MSHLISLSELEGQKEQNGLFDSLLALANGGIWSGRKFLLGKKKAKR